MAVASVQLNFRIPADLYEKLEAAAAQVKDSKKESKTEIVRKALEEYLERIEKSDK